MRPGGARRLRLGRRPAGRDRPRHRPGRPQPLRRLPRRRCRRVVLDRSRPAARCCSSAASSACVRGGDDAGACARRPCARSARTRSRSRPTAPILYAAAKNADAVAVLQRDPTTGALSQQPGQYGCTRLAGGLGCATARSLGPALRAGHRPGRPRPLRRLAVRQRRLAPPAGRRHRHPDPARRRGGLHRPGDRRLLRRSAPDGPAGALARADATSLTVATAGDGTLVTLHRDVSDGPARRRAGTRRLHLRDRCRRLSGPARSSVPRHRSRSRPRVTSSMRRRAPALDRARAPGPADLHQARAARGRRRADAGAAAVHRPERRRAHLCDLTRRPRTAACSPSRAPLGDLQARSPATTGPRRLHHQRQRRLGRR